MLEMQMAFIGSGHFLAVEKKTALPEERQLSSSDNRYTAEATYVVPGS